MVVLAGPFGLGPTELVVVLAILVLLFGATRLADLGGSLGKSIKEFRKAVKEEDAEEAEAPVASTPAPVRSVESNGAEMVTAVKCASCGTLNAATAKHCSQCGAAIAATVP